MKLKSYHNFLNEKNESQNPLYDEVKSEIKGMIEKSLKTSDKKTVEEFIQAFKRNSEETKIEGLINDADIYEFYLKYRNVIDEKLSEVKFYEQKPSEIGCFSLYDYIVKGTEKSLVEFISDIS